MEESAGKDLEVKRSGAVENDALSQTNDLLIDVSSSSTLAEDRSSGPGNETSLEQIETTKIDADKADDMAHPSENIEELPKLIETKEPEKSGKNPKFNLRKSLAWDSAFFTSDGVLDAEELSSMIEGGEKKSKPHLPGIEEDVYRSMESISTLESDNLTLECLEADLFEDIRASIQKSNTTSNLNNSTIKIPSVKKDPQAKASTSSKKVDLDSGKRPAARIKDNNTSSIPKPKVISRVAPTSTLTKRASFSTNEAKNHQDLAKKSNATQKGIQAAKSTTTTQGSKSKSTVPIAPRRGVPKPLPSSSTRPSSSCSNSSSSSGNELKSSTSLMRKKVDSKNGINPTTPSRVSTKSKAPPVNSRLSTHSILSNLSSNISPASSISSFSSESSSTSTVNRRSATSRSSVDTGVSHKSFDGDADSALSVHSAGGNLNQSGSLSRPPAFQPTGLRMPSPKIGFFDGGKSGVRTPNGSSIRAQPKLPAGVPKTGPMRSSPTSNSNSVKLPPPKTGLQKPNPQKTASKPSQEQQPKTNPCLLSSDDIKIVCTEDNICINPFDYLENDSNKESHLGNGEVVAVKDDDKAVKSLLDGLRTPFAVKNSVCDSNESGKPVDFLFMESQHKENSELI